VGTFNNVTVNGKGLVTGASNIVYASGNGSATGTNTGDNATNTQYSGFATSKENTITAGTTSQYFRGDKTMQPLNITAVTGLQTALDGKQNNLGFTPYNATNPSGFTANSTDAQLRDRTTHTGVQAIATVTGLQTALDGKQNNLGFTPYNATNPSGFTANSTDAQLRDRTLHTGVQAIATVTGLQTALDGKQNNLGFTPYNATNPSGFTANSTDAQLRDRTLHTGVQAIATVTGLQTALDGKQNNLGFTPYNATNPSGFTANSTDAQLRDRTLHTGVQAIATVTGLQSALDSKQATGDYATNTTVTNGLNTKINNSEKAVANGVATLGSDGKVPNNQIPALAISETFEVTTQAAMLALTGVDQGDVAVRSDVSKAFILRQLPSTTLANWVELLTPASTVTSVAGKVGAVVLNSNDVGLANVPNTNFTSAVTANTSKITNATHTGDATGSTALTLATVNANVGTFNNVTVNGKGLVTGASNIVYASGNGSATGTNTGDDATNTQYSGLATSKENTITAGTTSQYFRGDKTFQTLNKTAVGLSNADDTSDLNKPISTATQTALNAKISGSGITNQLAKFTASGTVGPSSIFDNGFVGLGTTNPTRKFTADAGNGSSSSFFKGGLLRGDEILSSLLIGYQDNLVNNSAQYGYVYNTVSPLLSYAHITSFGRTEGSQYKFLANGNFGINQPNPIEKLDVVGNGKFSGTVTATSFFQSSDIRLKNIIKRDGDVIYYTWKDKRDTKSHIGYIAQKVIAKNPDQVNKDDEGYLSVNYIEILVEKIRNLEKEIELLKAK
jgi:hypothetical protein